MSLRIRIVLMSTAAIWLVILVAAIAPISTVARMAAASPSPSIGTAEPDYFLFQSTRVEGCGQVRSLARKTGKIEIKGSTITFLPVVRVYNSVNDCRPEFTGSWSFEAQDLEPVVLHWQLEDGKLRITDPNGEASGIYGRL